MKMDKDTKHELDGPKSACFTPKTTGIIINGEIHLLEPSNSAAPCLDCSLRGECGSMPWLPCVMLSDNDHSRFRKI